MAGANAMTKINLPLASLSKSPKFPIPLTSTSVRSSPFPLSKRSTTEQASKRYSYSYRVCRKRGGAGIVCGLPLPVDPWAPTIDSQSIASQLFAFSLFPYIGFLYFITKSKTAPNLTLFGFYFLLAFVGATIPAGIYAKVHYGTSLSNVDWLHGGAESFLTLTNLFLVLGLREGLRKSGKSKSEQNASASDSGLKEEEKRRMEV